MKKWIIVPLLGSLLSGGTWAAAQTQNDPSTAAPAVQGGTIEIQGGPVTATVNGSGAIVVTGSAMAVPAGMPAPPPGATVTTAGGLIAGPNVATGPGVVTFRRIAQPGQPMPGPGIQPVQTIGVRRLPGEPGMDVPPPMAMPVPIQGNGPVWINKAITTLAGKAEKTAFLGVVTTRATATLRAQLKLKAGLVVEIVEPKSSAETAGLQVHDVIEKCDDQWLINPAQFIELVRIYKPGETVTLTVLRQGERKKITAKLDERETIAFDDDGNFFYAQKGLFDPDNPQGPASAPPEGGFGAVQRITAGALGAAPLRPGFVATFGDDKQQLLITIRDGHQILTAKDPSGKQIFQGPVDTPEQRKLVPQDVRKKLEEMEKIKVKIRTPNFQELPPGFDTPQVR
jgi:hypothetical protein